MLAISVKLGVATWSYDIKESLGEKNKYLMGAAFYKVGHIIILWKSYVCSLWVCIPAHKIKGVKQVLIREWERACRAWKEEKLTEVMLGLWMRSMGWRSEVRVALQRQQHVCEVSECPEAGGLLKDHFFAISILIPHPFNYMLTRYCFFSCYSKLSNVLTV